MLQNDFIKQIATSHLAVNLIEFNSWLPQIKNWIDGKTEIDISQTKGSVTSFCGTDIQNSVRDINKIEGKKIAIIEIEGAMLAKGSFWFYGMDEIASFINQSVFNENIIGTVLKFNTGGGTTDAVVPLMNAIENHQKSGKPIVAFVNKALSAGTWTATKCDKVILSNSLASMGSIGTFAKLINIDKYYKEKVGLEITEVYAPQSTEKNKPLNNALNGNTTLLKDELLKPVAAEFISVVKKNRKGKINNSVDGLFNGKVFNAKDSIKAGLADEIGTMSDAINYITQNSDNNISTINNSQSNNSQSNNSQSNIQAMNKKNIPAVLIILGLDEIKVDDKSIVLSSEQIGKIKDTLGKGYQFKGVSIDIEGNVTFSEESMLALNEEITNRAFENQSKEDTEAMQAKDAIITELTAKLDKISNEPEEVILPKEQTKIEDKFVAPTSGVNIVDNSHSWNKAALGIANGDNTFAEFLKMKGLTKSDYKFIQNEFETYSSDIDMAQMNTILGEFHRVVDGDIKDMMVASESLDAIFPKYSTGIKDEYAHIAIMTGEFFQARNGQWSEKGNFELQAEVNKLKNWQVSHRFTSKEMWGFITSWLASKTKGTDPFQMSLVQWLVSKMLFHMWKVERPKQITKGVHVVPVDGEAGSSIHSTNGLFWNTLKRINEYKILPFEIGRGTYAHMVDGEENKNHVYHKINELIGLIPQDLRDGFTWDVYISKEDYRQREIFIKQVVASDANYKLQEQAESFVNFKIRAIPHWKDGLIIISLPKNYLQAYREKADDNRITFDKEKRDTILHMDGAANVAPSITGKKFATYAELLASKGNDQRIFTNNEFGAFTPIDILADVTKISLENHNVIRTAENTAATDITNIADYSINQNFYLIGGSDTNPTTIKATNTKFIGLEGTDIVLKKGVVVRFKVVAIDTYVLIEAPRSISSEGTITFDVDEDTPDIASGTKFYTNASNTSVINITGFEGAIVGKQFTVIGAGGTNVTTIDKAGAFASIASNWSGDLGKELNLIAASGGKFMEISRA